MSDEKKFNYGILSSDGTGKFYHRPGLEYYAAKVEAERAKERENAKVILKEKRMNAGSTHYTFSILQSKNTKPYLRISGFIEKKNYRGTVVVFSPYVPAFLGILQELSSNGRKSARKCNGTQIVKFVDTVVPVCCTTARLISRPTIL